MSDGCVVRIVLLCCWMMNYKVDIRGGIWTHLYLQAQALSLNIQHHLGRAHRCSAMLIQYSSSEHTAHRDTVNEVSVTPCEPVGL